MSYPLSSAARRQVLTDLLLVTKEMSHQERSMWHSLAQRLVSLQEQATVLGPFGPLQAPPETRRS